MFKHTPTALVLGLALGLCHWSAAKASADNGILWSVDEQSGQLLNRLGTWEWNGGVGRIWLAGAFRMLEVSMAQPVRTEGGLPVFVFVTYDTKAQPTNPKIWDRIAAGELRLNLNTGGNFAEGWLRQTGVLHEYPDSTVRTEDIRQWERVRFTSQ